MEIVQKYTIGFHDILNIFNTLPPSIEPTATGHISEQIEMVKAILESSYAYEIDGTVYFDVEKYNKDLPYGILTNRKLEDLLEGTRELGGQNEKKGRLDFALWIKAKPETLMQWPSPWGWGFPGWHIECSAMSTKYLGATFDIHGGGMDLQATHHTNEIAQSQACNHTAPAKYWMHTNMLTVNGVRMSKTAGNGFLPKELFTGAHPLLERGYTPMTVRFFMAQSHYRSTLDFSNEALQASEKGFERLMDGYARLQKLQASATSSIETSNLRSKCEEAMNDDFNTPIVIAHLFEALKAINLVSDGKGTISAKDLEELKAVFGAFIEDVLGLKAEGETSGGNEAYKGAIDLLLNMRLEAKQNKDWATSDKIRNELTALGFEIKDTKDGFEWKI